MLSPEYKGIEPNEKYRSLEVQAARRLNAIPEFRRDSPDEYFTKQEMIVVSEIRQRMKLVKF